MISKEQHMKIIENQRKIYEQIEEKTMRTTEKPMKNQRRNNEKQWKTKDNFASILNYFRPVTFCPCFFRVFHLPWVFTKPCKYAVNCIFFVHMCFKRGYFSVCCFLGTLMEENTPAGENLACHFLPKICILYGNTVVRGLAHWNLECSQAGILKYHKNRVFGGILNSNCKILENLASILSFSVSL